MSVSDAASTEQTIDQLATFYVGGEMFGIDVRDVQEVLVEQAVTRVPLAPPHLVGLTNLRGQILPAFDLRRRLGMTPLPPGSAPTSNLVVKTAEGPVSLIVDEIGDVRQVARSLCLEVPETVPLPQRQFVSQITPLDGCLILRLDLARVFDDDPLAAVALTPVQGT